MRTISIFKVDIMQMLFKRYNAVYRGTCHHKNDCTYQKRRRGSKIISYIIYIYKLTFLPFRFYPAWMDGCSCQKRRELFHLSVGRLIALASLAWKTGLHMNTLKVSKWVPIVCILIEWNTNNVHVEYCRCNLILIIDFLFISKEQSHQVRETSFERFCNRFIL